MGCLFSAINLPRVFRRANLAEYPQKPSTQHVQEHGYANLADLPVELLLEITSYFSHQTACRKEIFRRMPDPIVYFLWKTNRKLRSVFLGVLWEDLDAYAFRYPSTSEKGWKAMWKEMARVMERRMKGVLDNHELSDFVRTINIAYNKPLSHKLSGTFLRSLQKLPNVHTLQLVAYSASLPSLLAGYKFPQIQQLAAPQHSMAILNSFPEVRVIICTRFHGVVSDRGLEDLIDAVEIVCFIIAALNLRHIKFRQRVTHDTSAASLHSQTSSPSQWMRPNTLSIPACQYDSTQLPSEEKMIVTIGLMVGWKFRLGVTLENEISGANDS